VVVWASSRCPERALVVGGKVIDGFRVWEQDRLDLLRFHIEARPTWGVSRIRIAKRCELRPVSNPGLGQLQLRGIQKIGSEQV
jgi:hypothetical protein